MGKAHSNAYKTLAYMTWPPPLLPQLVAIAGRNEEAVSEAARRYGFAEYVTDWHALVADDRVQLFDNSGPNNLHAEPTIAAAEAGKHVICEKPLGRDAAESLRDLAARRGRRRQAHVRLQLPLRAGRAAGAADDRVRRARRDHALPRAPTCRSGAPTDDALWRFDKDAAGSGALGDLGAHVIDLARYLVGEIETVAALTATFQPGRRGRRRDRGGGRASRAARSARSRRRASPPAARTPSRGRSTAPRARSRSTSSG